MRIIRQLYSRLFPGNTQSSYWRSVSFTACTVNLLYVLPSLAFGQSNYAAFELKREDNFDPLYTYDMNGDSLRDVIVSSYEPAIGRELHIYLQQPDGSFAANPLRIEIKTEIIAVGFADLRPDPGVELVLLANNGVYSLSAMQPGYAGNIKQLVDWELIASMPNLERVQFFDAISDLNNDKLPDMILPGVDNYGIFYGRANEEFELVSTITTLNASTTAIERSNPRTNLDAQVSINPDDGVKIELTANHHSPFEGFVEQWQSDSDQPEYLLQSQRWMPAIIPGAINADPLLDLIYLNVGEDKLGQLNVHLQHDKGGFGNSPDWTASIDSRGNWRLVNINQDSALDIMRLRGEGDDWTVQLFINHDGSFQLDQPDQVMRFSGYDLRLDFLQLQAGGPTVLNASYYTIPVVNAIRNPSINRTQLLYGPADANSGEIFNKRPDSRLEESFSAANVRGLSEQMSLRYDVDGDGNKDALYITDNGTLAARHISATLDIAPDPFWQYVSKQTVFEFEVLSLNNDTIPDLILRHGTSTTLLVGRP